MKVSLVPRTSCSKSLLSVWRVKERGEEREGGRGREGGGREGGKEREREGERERREEEEREGGRGHNSIFSSHRLVVRIDVGNMDCASPLGLKFGCTVAEAKCLLDKAVALGLNVVGTR